MTDHDYIRQLAAQLDRATEFRIPCPGHPFGKVVDLLVLRRTDGHGDGWTISDGDGHAWTGTAWQPRSVLAPSDIYRYTRDEAITEAERIAPAQTVQFLAIHADRYGPRETTPGYDAALAATEHLARTRET
jgi:hypothetical protein